MTQSSIITVTLNPALDMTTATDRVQPGLKLHCDAPRVDPGGGGINVSRVVHELGGHCVAIVASGGTVGAQLMHLLDHAGLSTVEVAVRGETRQSLAVNDRESGGQYRFIMPGPNWRAIEAEAMLVALSEVVTKGALVVLSGGLPPGVDPAYQDRLIARVRAAGALVLADTSGAALAHLAAGSGLHVLRMNRTEAEALAGHPMPSSTESGRFAKALVRRGAAEAVIIARGSEGAILALEDRCLHVTAATVPVRSKVGAGDSFVGALVLARARGADWETALAAASAAASAAVMTEATELCHRADAERLIDQVTVTRLSA